MVGPCLNTDALVRLLNPVTINVSTRGSADSIVAAMVLATVAFVLQGTQRWHCVWRKKADRVWVVPRHACCANLKRNA